MNQQINTDIEAEQAVLGSLIYRNDLLPQVASILDKAEYFYDVRHKHIYTAMLALDEAESPIDEILLFNQLGKMDKVQATGGLPYINELTDYAEAPANVETYANIVKEQWRVRQLSSAASHIQDSTSDRTTGSSEKIEQAQVLLENLVLSGTQEGLVHANVAAKEAFERLEVLSANDSEVSGASTGLLELDNITHGLQDQNLIILAARAGVGKAQPLTAKVLLRNGKFCNMGDIEVGDSLASIDGEESIVENVYPQGKKEVYTISTSDGRSTECCKEHLWKVMFGEWEFPKIVSTEWLVEKLKFKRYKNRIHIDRFNGDFGESKNCVIDPYLLGVLLGDGGLSGVSVKLTTSESHILDKVKNIVGDEMISSPDKITYRITQGRGKENHILDGMKKLGLMGHKSVDKFIPEQYLEANKSTRISLLQGLMDTDGTVEKSGAATYSTSSLKLKDCFVRLVRSLGFYCSVSEKYPTYMYKGEKKKGQKNYVIFISGVGVKGIITLPRKRNRLNNIKTDRRKLTTISSIIKTVEKDCQCISVSHKDRLYITDDYIVTHNTAAALNIATEIAKTKLVPFFSLEMSKAELVNRILSALGRIDATKLKTGQLDESDWDRIAYATDELGKLNLYIDDRASLTVQQVVNECKKLSKVGEIGAVFIDYLQLLKGSGKTNSRQEEIADISRALKRLAKDLKVPVVALSQLNRELEKRADKRPVMSDLRESGAIEQDADLIMFIYRDEVYNKDSEDVGVAEFIIGKHRNGSTGTVRTQFTGKYTKFSNLQSTYRSKLE